MAWNGGMANLGTRIAVVAWVVCALAAPSRASETWSAYLDYAFVYSSAEPKALRERLEGYARETGMTLEEFRSDRRQEGADPGEAERRRLAVAHLLDYLTTGSAESLTSAVRAVDALEDRLTRHENRYWYHYIRAHEALHYGDAKRFVNEVLALWFGVIVELEAPYETYQTLSLDHSARVGFAAAIPYLYENIARLVLIRSQQMGLHAGLDPLAVVIRFLGDGRLGAYPDAIPAEASAREYLERVLARLEGPESDGGSLSFTLALFEAAKHHDRARGLLASEGFSEATLDAVRVSIGAYETALRQARTLQGQTAVYTRVLRQLGELYAARQRLGEDPKLDVPFRIDRAKEIFAALHEARDGEWGRHGYLEHGREAYVRALRGLWEEIQEATFNAAEYYLAEGLRDGQRANEDLNAAARFYAGYLELFDTYAADQPNELVPESAYFAAYWASKGVGDAILHFAGGNPSTRQLEEAIAHYERALRLFPFDRKLWAALALALERQGRESQFLRVTKPVAERVARSASLDTWIRQGRKDARALDVLRRALSEDLVILYFGFADASRLDELERGLEELRARRDALTTEMAELERRLEALRNERAALANEPPLPASLPAVSSTSSEPPRSGIPELTRRLEELVRAQERLDRQIEAREQALPLFREALDVEGLVEALLTQRDHPVHGLVRRMAFESEPRSRR